MTAKRLAIGSVLILLLAGVAWAGLAQEASGETFVSSDGTFTFVVPQDWFVQEGDDGLIALSENEDALGGQALPEGSVLFTVATPAYLESIGVSGETPAEVLVGFAEHLKFEVGDRKGLRLGERVAVQADFTEGDVNGSILAVKLEDGSSGLIVTFTHGDPADVADTAQQIAGTFALAEAAQQAVACTVSTDQDRTVNVRVGPGINRTSFAFLPANQDFDVLGKATAEDGTLWWKLDKQAVAPKKAANEAWIAQEDVEAAGDCDLVQDAAAPPVVRIVPKTPSTGGTTGGTGAPLNTGGGRGIFIDFPEWQSQLPGDIQASSIQSAKLVVYVTPMLTNIERAPYIKSNGEVTLVERNRVDYVVRVVNASTGAELGNQVFMGGEPPGFPPTLPINGVLNGPPPNFADVLPFIQSFL